MPQSKALVTEGHRAFDSARLQGSSNVRVDAHGLRHARATHLLAMGHNPAWSATASAVPTSPSPEVCGHVLPGHQREAAEAAAGLMD